MRSRKSRSRRATARRDQDEERRSLISTLRQLGWSPRDAVGFAVAVAAILAILVNALFLQSGPHPAPIFRGGLLPLASAETTSAVVATPRARPPGATAVSKTDASAGARSAGEIVADIQRELTRRGFYEGVADGFYGPKTDAAVRDFEQAAGVKSDSEPSEALLRAITRSNVRAARASSVGNAAAPIRAIPNPDPGASKRVTAVQRALSDYGYGQIKPTGVIDADTRAAIEKFERERKLPVTGQVTDRITRELSALTGRSLD